MRAPFRHYLLAALLSGLGLAAQYGLKRFDAFAPFAFVALYVSVVLSAWTGGLGPGLLSTAILAVGGRLFFIEPTLSLTIHRASDAARIGWFVSTGMLISILNGRSLEVARRLKRSENQLSIALRAGKTHLWEWELSTNLVWRSSNHDTLFGLRENLADFTAADFIQTIHPDDRELVAKRIRDALAGTAPYDVEYRVPHPDGSIHWIHTVGSVQRDEDGEPLAMAGASVETTERKRTAQALEEALRARDEFLSIASHELRTPITSLKLQIQMTRKQVDPEKGSLPPPDRLARALEVSRRQADRLTHLVDDLLDVSRIQAGRLDYDFSHFDLKEALTEVLDRMEEHLRDAECPVTIKAPESGLRIRGDRGRIEQVFVNLLSNAAKYGERKPVEVVLGTRDDLALISIQDQGIGIPREKHDVIFDRFERAIHQSNVSGLGLGLFISKQIVEAHRGRITVESELGQGSTFTVELPADTAG